MFPSTLLKSHGRRRALRVRLRRSRTTRRACKLHLPRERRLRPLAFRPSAWLALRGDGRGRRVRRRARAVGERAPVPRRRALQRRPTRAPAPSSHMAHQVVVKNIAKTEFMLGLARLLMVDTIGVESFQHIQEKLAEIWVNLETMQALLRAAEADAALDEWGVMRPAWNPLDAARNLFPRLYPRMVEIIQQIGASGLVAMPTRAGPQGPARRRHPPATTRQPAPRRSTASRCSGSPGTPRSRRSARARCSTSGSSSAIPCAWPARSSPPTTRRFAATRSTCASSSATCATKRSGPPKSPSVSRDRRPAKRV